MTRTHLGSWLVRGSLGETPASVMRRHPPARVYEPGPLDDAHREYAHAELDALIGVCNRGRLIAVAVRETDRNN
jgi:hypothetical protein